MSAINEWPKRRLDELTEQSRPITYGVVKPGDHDDENGVRFVRGGDIAEGKINIAALRTITSKVSARYKRTVLRGGEVVVSLVGNPGEAAVVPASLCGANIARQAGLVALRSDVDPRFIMYFLRSPGGRAELFAQTTGSVQKVINLANLKNVRVSLPDLPTQRKIAGILSAYDDLIENNLRRIKILEEMAQSLYREWFVHTRFPGHESVRHVDSDLGPIPKGWEVRTIEELVKRIHVGKKYDQKTANPTGTVPIFDQGKTGVIGYHDDQPGVEASETEPVIVFANHTCYQRLIHYPFSAIQNVLPFLPNPLLPRNIYWLHYATNGRLVLNDYKGHWPEFAALLVVVPSAEICQRFGAFVAPLSLEILKLEQAVDLLRRTRDLLLPKLLSSNSSDV